MDETNDFVGHKAAYALSQDLSVIACIGETLHERQAGQLEEVLTKQLTAIGDNIAGTIHAVRHMCGLAAVMQKHHCTSDLGSAPDMHPDRLL